MKIAFLTLIAALGMGALVALGSVVPAPACLDLELTPGYVMRTIDGDTFILYSIAVPPEERVRVLNVNSPELRSGATADSARAFTDRWLHSGTFRLYACKRDSFGRLLAVVSRGGSSLADSLIALHLGVPYR